MRVANRTLARAEALAQELGGEAQARRFEDLPQLLAEADVVVTSTAAPQPIFTRELVQPALKARRGRPLFLVDLAVPRDVDPGGAPARRRVRVQRGRPGAGGGREPGRARERGRAGRGAHRRGGGALHPRKTARDAVPVLGQLRRRADAIALAEAERTLAVLGEGLPREARQSVEAMANAIVNKLLHAPTARLRTAGEAGPEEAARVAAAAAELFGLADRRADVDGEPRSAPIPITRAEGHK